MISGKSVLIVGGSSGIGKHLALSLLKEKNKVLIASNNLSSLEQATDELRKISPNVSSYFVEVNENTSVQKMSEIVLREHGCPDILVNCAGFSTYRTFEQSPVEEIERIVGVNFLGTMRCTHSFLPTMIARGGGSIVIIASIAGKLVMTPNGIYSASKHGLVAWSKVIKYELARYKIDVSVICPGRVQTAFFDHETFKTRLPRRETQITIPLEKVSRKIISAIEKKKFMTYIPSYYGLLIWLINTFSYFSKPVYKMLLSSRIEDIYMKKS